MWYEIKQKQKNISKARANINVYSSTAYSRVKRTPESEKKQMSVYLIKRKIEKNMVVYVPGTYWYVYQVRIYPLWL